jgi:hypothetical protein
MKSPARVAVALLMVAFGIAASTSVLARGYARGHGHGGSVRFGLFVGAPVVLSSGYWGPHYYAPSPYYSPYYPPVVAVPASPPIYVEQGPTSVTPAAPQPGFWYYCNDARAYYPYVKECPGGWQRVSPQPPPG